MLFLFGTSHPILGNSSNAPELGLAMRGYWSSFAASGDPGGELAWPEWSEATDPYLHFATPSDVETGYLDAKCDFWDTLFDTVAR